MYRDCYKSKEISGKLRNYLARRNCRLPTLQATLATICVFMQTQFKLGSYIHACTNETHSIANLQDLIPSLAAIIRGNTN